MPYTHGGDIYGDAAVELDFSVNTNRLGMPQAVRDAVMASAAAWEQYPDALCRKLRRAAAAFYEADGTPIPEDWLVFGNGASDILYHLRRSCKWLYGIKAVPLLFTDRNFLN